MVRYVGDCECAFPSLDVADDQVAWFDQEELLPCQAVSAQRRLLKEATPKRSCTNLAIDLVGLDDDWPPYDGRHVAHARAARPR